MTSKHPLLSTPGKKMIPVIASFDAQGNIRPLYARINGLDYKILSSVSIQATREYVGFECRIEDYGRIKKFELFFSLEARVWFMEYSGRIST